MFQPTTDQVKFYVGIAVPVMTVLFTWLKDRSAGARRLQALEESTKRVQFWDVWSKALPTNIMLPTGMGTQPALEMISAAQVARDAFVTGVRTPGVLRRWLLLYRQPTDQLWRLRLYFYSGVLEMVLFSAQLYELFYRVVVLHARILRPGRLAILVVFFCFLLSFVTVVRLQITKINSLLPPHR